MSLAPAFSGGRLAAALIAPVPPRASPERCVPGPWMPGQQQPETRGRYLRQIGERRAWSWWRGGLWYPDEDCTHPSPVQNAPWQGVMRSARDFSNATPEMASVPRG